MKQSPMLMSTISDNEMLDDSDTELEPTSVLKQSPRAPNGTSLLNDDDRSTFVAMEVKTSAQYSASKSASNPAATQSFQASTVFKSVLLLLLVFQNSAQTLVIRYSRGILHEPYSILSTVLASECIKLCLCVLVIQRQHAFNFKLATRRSFDCLLNSLPMAVPAVLYLCQNKLNYVALTYLSSAAHSMISQLKLLTTAIFAGLILRKVLYAYQWRALMLLFIGVVLVQSKPGDPNAPVIAPAADWTAWLERYMGVAAGLAQATLSGLAGVYTEWQLKKGVNDFTLWERNLQMSFYSVVFGFLAIPMSAQDYSIISTNGFFYGFSIWSWCCVALQSFGGLLIAAVMAYMDNISKNFATSIAILVTSAVSFAIFHDVTLDNQFICGTANVIIAVFIYSEDIKALAKTMGMAELPK